MIDRVVCINLDRRPDRFERFMANVQSIEWPFGEIERFAAIDGKKVPPPNWWRAGCGAWGIHQSHVQILAKALADGVTTLAIFEDDAVFAQSFANDAQTFVSKLPGDHDGFMLGGQHLQPPHAVSDGVLRVTNGNRCHAHVLRGRFIEAAYRHLCDYVDHAKRPFQHVDHRFGNLHGSGQYNIYAPQPWLVGQADGFSDIANKRFGMRFWNGKPPVGPPVALLASTNPPAVGKLVAVTTYFNPGGYTSMREKYERFKANLNRQGVELVTVEIAVGDQPFETDATIQLRTESPLWFKENAINIAVAQLPADVSCVAWLDNDVLLEDSWAEQAIEALAEYPVVQPFDTARDLGSRGQTIRTRHGLAYGIDQKGASAKQFTQYMPGLAWVARREVLDKVPLYDRAIVGGGDVLTAFGFYGINDASLLDSRLAALTDFSEWSRRMHRVVGGQVGWLPLTIDHLYHGDKRNRRYEDRYSILDRHRFCPHCDIRHRDDGLIELYGKPHLQTAIAAYFQSRKEDG